MVGYCEEKGGVDERKKDKFRGHVHPHNPDPLLPMVLLSKEGHPFLLPTSLRR